ncbi:hypothetical protein diail_10167, partial [Diaporthe ilicicola]
LSRWPVIAIIIVLGLFVFSIIWCIARCLCCGLSCCCECCYCLKCCGNCCGCCDAPKNHRRKYLDDPYVPAPDHSGYRSEPAMIAGAIPTSRSKAADPPQYATFDVSKKEEGDDALPAMPTWEASESKRLEAEAESVELQHLRKPESNGPNQPLLNGMSPAATPGATTPVGQNARSPYGPQGPQAAASGYMGAGPGAGAYGMKAPPYSQMHNGYDQSQAAFHSTETWGVTGGQDYGQMPGPSPGEYGGYNQSPVQTPGYDERGGYNDYGMPGSAPGQPAMDQYGMAGAQPERRGPPRGAVGAVGGAGARASPAPRGSPAPAPPPQQDYGFGGGQFDAPPRTYSPAPVQRTFSPAPPQRNFSPAPPQRTFSPAAPQRQFSADSAPAPGRRPMPPRGPPSRQFSADSAPNPQRQYSSSSPRPLAGGGMPGGRPPPRRQFTADPSPGPPSPGPMNSGGFDFQSGFSRPPPRVNTFDNSYNGGGGGGGQQEETAAYPGYKPYQPK